VSTCVGCVTKTSDIQGLNKVIGVNVGRIYLAEKSLGRNFCNWGPCARSFVWLGLYVLLWGSPVLAQSQAEAGASAGQQASDQQSRGSICGTVLDPSGAAVGGAQVKLTSQDQLTDLGVLSNEDGQFLLDNIAPGPFQLTIAAKGFAPQALLGVLHPGEIYYFTQIALALAPEKTEVQVVVPRMEVAEGQIKAEEKQRVLGFLPNFYVSYVPDAAPLTSKQKFKLAWRSTLDPVDFLLTGAVAGIQQADNVFSGYGQGARGYGKRYGADFADSVTTTFVGSAMLPSLLKQDPRFFYKANGSTRSRILYALAMAVVCKGDDGRWQANYSSLLGSLAAGGISNLYFPPQDRKGARLTFENAGIGIGTTAVANLLQEFLIRKLTPNVRNHDPAIP
jgi:carboxypeptidase family protein